MILTTSCADVNGIAIMYNAQAPPPPPISLRFLLLRLLIMMISCQSPPRATAAFLRLMIITIQSY